MKIHYECNVNQREIFTPKYLHKVLKVTDRRYTNYCNLQALAQVRLKQWFSNFSMPQKRKGLLQYTSLLPQHQSFWLRKPWVGVITMPPALRISISNKFPSADAAGLGTETRTA